MRRATLFGALALCLSIPTLISAQTMSHEEEVVRNAYAKFSLLCGLPPVTNAAVPQLAGTKVDLVSLQAKVANATPVFDLSDFQIGAVSMIANDPWGDFVTAPSGEYLVGQIETQQYSDNGNTTSWDMVNVRWKPYAKLTSQSRDAILSATVAKVIKIASRQWQPAGMPLVTYTKYAAYTVNVTFQGKSSGPHKAIFFFGTDAKGKEYVAPNDIISGPSPLDYVANHLTEMEPSGLLLGKLREAPVVADWLRANVISDSSCSDTTRALCCSRGHCGIPATVFNRDLETPLPPSKN